MEQIRKDIVDFKTSKNLDQLIILWTANTERFSEILPGINDTADNLLKAIKDDHPEVSPSTVFAVAAALEGVNKKYTYYCLSYCKILFNFVFYLNISCNIPVYIYKWFSPKYFCTGSTGIISEASNIYWWG